MSQGKADRAWMRNYQRERDRRLRNGERMVPPISQELLELEWRDIPGFPGYKASKCGQIMSIERKLIRSNGKPFTVPARIVKPRRNSKGRGQAGIYVNNKRVYLILARLIYLTWHGPIPPGMDVDHIDENNQNDHADNLQTLTNVENVRKHWRQRK